MTGNKPDRHIPSADICARNQNIESYSAKNAIFLKYSPSSVKAVQAVKADEN
jgi:hypothetical protein